MPDVPNNREGPQAREPSKCLNGQSYEERLAKEAFCSPATRGSKKDSDRAITPVAESVCVPAHLAHKSSSCAIFPLNSHWGRAATLKKKSLAYMYTWSLWSCPTLCDPVDCGLPGFSVREGVLQARILEHIGQYWLPYPSAAAALAANSPEYLVLPEPLQPKQLHHLHTWPSQGQAQVSRTASGASPSGRPTCRGGNKATIETERQCG